MFNIQVTGFDQTAAQMVKVADTFAKATEYALASTAKMVRNRVKNDARGTGTSGFAGNNLGWPALSKFTGTLSKASGATKDAFIFAKRTVRDFGWTGAQDRFLNKSAINSEDISRTKTTALKRAIRKARGKKIGFKGRTVLGRDGTKTFQTKKVKLDNRSQPFSRMLNFVSSRILLKSGEALVSLFSGNGNTPDTRLTDLVAKHERGFSFSVTDKMRRFFFAAGMPTRQRSISVPARPWFSKVFSLVSEAIPRHFNERFAKRMKSVQQKNNITMSELR
jgi:hypothetical protein